MNGILHNWESLCDIRPDCQHHFDASGTSNAMFDELAERSLMSSLCKSSHNYLLSNSCGTSNAMFDELAERSLMSSLAGTKHTYVRLAIIIYCQILALFFSTEIISKISYAFTPLFIVNFLYGVFILFATESK